MKNYDFPIGVHLIVLLLFLALLGVPSEARASSRRLVLSKSEEAGASLTGDQTGLEQQYQTGSSLLDSSHACGRCEPCKRVIVSYKCATESCPIVYRCMCKGKYYHVPSH